MKPMNRSVAIVLLLTACATNPGVVAAQTAPRYRADLKACRASAGHAVYLENAKTFPAWVMSPLTEPGQMHRAMHACMLGRGYAAR